MSVLNEALTASGSPQDVDAIEAQINYLGGYFWTWYEQHQNDRIADVKFLFINVGVKVYHLRTLFLLLFGPPRV